MKTKILYVEDEPNLGQIVYDTLNLKGFEVIWETDGALVMSHFNHFSPDLCLLDIMLPNVDGFELCQHIRSKFSSLPIIFLTARSETRDLVKGFESGGTDYLKKPFSIEELLVRVENQLRLHQSLETGHYSGNEILSDEIKLGRFKYFPKRYELQTPSETINLSSREGDLLKLLTAKGSKIIDRKEILMTVWGDDSFFNSRNLDVYIRKLRNYFDEDPNIEIQTLRGKGYLFLIRQ